MKFLVFLVSLPFVVIEVGYVSRYLKWEIANGQWMLSVGGDGMVAAGVGPGLFILHHFAINRAVWE